jgi:hypothetical protein
MNVEKNNKIDFFAVDSYQENFKDYPHVLTLLQLLNKQKPAELPYCINYSSFINRPHGEKNALLIDADTLIFVVDKLLDIIGFKKMIKDYVIVAVTSFYSTSDSNTRSFVYSFSVLFNEPKLDNYEKTQELLHPQYFNKNNPVKEEEFSFLKKFISVHFDQVCYSSVEMHFLKKYLGTQIAEYSELKNNVFSLIDQYYAISGVSLMPEVDFIRYYSSEELDLGLREVFFFEDQKNFKTDFLWYGIDWINFGSLRVFLIDKNFKKVDIKVKGFGFCEHLFTE